MKAAYDKLISAAHAKGLLIYGATITPFGGSSYYSAAHESVRQQVNTYIKSGAFDGYIDFDAALTDGGDPPTMQSAYATWAADGLAAPGSGWLSEAGEDWSMPGPLHPLRRGPPVHCDGLVLLPYFVPGQGCTGYRPRPPEVMQPRGSHGTALRALAPRRPYRCTDDRMPAP